MTTMQQVQSTLSSEDPSSEEAQSDTQGSSSSLFVPGIGPKRAETFSGFDSKLKPDNLNKDNINRASSMRTERPGMGFPSRQLPGAVSPAGGASPKMKHKRRSSGGGGGWSFLSKSGGKEDKEQSGSTGMTGFMWHPYFLKGRGFGGGALNDIINNLCGVDSVPYQDKPGSKLVIYKHNRFS